MSATFKRSRRPRRPPLDEDLILSWADEHFQKYGVWPTSEARSAFNDNGDNWHALDMALRKGFRGLLPDSSLATLLQDRRGVINIRNQPKFTVETILLWADHHLARHGDYPSSKDVTIDLAPTETWVAVQSALCTGCRGLPGGSSLAQLLHEHRGKRHNRYLPPFTPENILDWANEHYKRTGEWPSSKSGPVQSAPGETWMAVQDALKDGVRGLAGGSSLARFLLEYSDKKYDPGPLPHTIEKITDWLKAYAIQHGRYPTVQSGAIEGAPEELWRAVDMCLTRGLRGLPGGSSLLKLRQELIQEGKLPENNSKSRSGRRKGQRILTIPALTEDHILSWADSHFERHGAWPNSKSGAVDDQPGENWGFINSSLRNGHRGLTSGSTLSLLLEARRSVFRHADLPSLTIEQILHWADEHFKRVGEWPNTSDGVIHAAPKERWSAVNAALRHGKRGLPGGTSLARLLIAQRDKTDRLNASSYSIETITDWLLAHGKRHGKYPSIHTGPIEDARQETTWGAVHMALLQGYRGLPGGSSLAKLKQDLINAGKLPNPRLL